MPHIKRKFAQSENRVLRQTFLNFVNNANLSLEQFKKKDIKDFKDNPILYAFLNKDKKNHEIKVPMTNEQKVTDDPIKKSAYEYNKEVNEYLNPMKYRASKRSTESRMNKAKSIVEEFLVRSNAIPNLPHIDELRRQRMHQGGSECWVGPA